MNKRNMRTAVTIGAIAVSGFVFAKAEPGQRGGMGGRWHGHGFAMEHLTQGLNLTAEQQAKVQPIIDQARPQIIAIHKEAMQKTRVVLDGAAAQNPPLLNADQQKKFDELQKARQDMQSARQRLHEAMKE